MSQDDDELERIWKAEHKLSEFLEEKNFKSYDFLKTKLNTVLNLNSDVQRETVEAPRAVKQESKVAKTADSVPWTEDDDDETLSYFEKLAQD